jgi:calcineurin-like phosphoesterase family protein
MIKFSADDDIFFTSDTHFCHENIIKYCDRPFSSVKEMNDRLIENWNSVVPKDATVFHLGDFALGAPYAWKLLASKLNGHKALILGNHDILKADRGCFDNFEMVAEQLTIKVGKRYIILSHYPLLCYHGVGGDESNIWNLHGHVHLRQSNRCPDESRLALTFPTQYDVGVDLNDFKPISFKQVRDIILTQVAKKENELYWVNGKLM